ncbi:hypothetical protein CXB51_011722 [Gossypium anomalum]|uniref:PORR domain-containing protein n=1 Tax=Gossypium anomalum TaxID=47600 RepID=A0A8J5Z9M6_9ROSI|nr:hypothetical protein CXB51_011722 [Gossypium anomalum]
MKRGSIITLSSSAIRCQKSNFMFVSVRQISNGGKRSKKKIYHRDYQLDKVMDLQKKPSLILQLKSIIQSQNHQRLLLRDLEKEVGFVAKWNFMSIIEKYPSIFRVGGGCGKEFPFVTLTGKAEKVARGEGEARNLMEPILVKNLRKLLMLSIDCRVPLEKVEFIGNELGLPHDFKKSLIFKYPEYFSIKVINGRAYLNLENWDSSLAVTAREERFARERMLQSAGGQNKVRIMKDGNYLGPFAFKMCYAAGFRPNKSYLEELEKWQKMEFPSPYLNARRFEVADPKTRKRVVAVLHELLSLTMEKRMISAKLDAFHSEYRLPSKLVLCLIKHHGIFYITNKGARSTVFLKEAYDGTNLVDKCPILMFNDKFVALSVDIGADNCKVFDVDSENQTMAGVTTQLMLLNKVMKPLRRWGIKSAAIFFPIGYFHEFQSSTKLEHHYFSILPHFSVPLSSSNNQMANDGALRSAIVWLSVIMVLVGLFTFSLKKIMVTYAFGMLGISGILLPDWDFFDRDFSRWPYPVTADERAALQARRSGFKRLFNFSFLFLIFHFISYTILEVELGLSKALNSLHICEYSTRH